MIKRIAHIVLSAWLAVLLVFGSTSKEFVHLFASHTDTVHCHSNTQDDLVLESEHHHCSFLHFTLAQFVNDVQVFHLPFQSIVYPQHQAEEVYSLIPCNTVTPLLRGPPALLV